MCVTVILPCLVKAQYLPVTVKSLQQLDPSLSGRYTVWRIRLHHLQTCRHTFKDQQGSDSKPTPKSWMYTNSKHLLQTKDDENGWGCKDDIDWNSNRLHYFFSPRLVFDIRLLIVESCSWHVSCSLCQKLWLSAGKQLIVVPHIHFLSWKTLHRRKVELLQTGNSDTLKCILWHALKENNSRDCVPLFGKNL